MSSIAHDPRGFLPYLLQALGVDQGQQQPAQPTQQPTRGSLMGSPGVLQQHPLRS